MTYKIRGTYIKTNRDVFVSTRKFKTSSDALDYIKNVVKPSKRFKNLEVIKV